MSKAIKFIHTADIHLGKNLSSNNTQNNKLQSIFDRADRKAFENLVDLAIKEEVDFILIAGDLYDREARSIRSSQFFLKKCQNLNDQGIELFIISGNHDPKGVENEVFKLPPNVKYFSAEKVETHKYYKEGELAARILGQSYRHKFEARKMYNYYTVQDKAVFNIALLHTALNKDNNHYVPVNKSELLTKKDIHYWGLGHLHQFQKINTEPDIYFPGAIQGHNISEEGNKGAILVEVDSNLNTNKKFIPLAEVIFSNLEINLEKEKKLNDITELQYLIDEKINKKLERIKKENKNKKYKIKAVIGRIMIKGRTEIHQYVKNNREELEETLMEEKRNKFLQKPPYFWVHSIYLRTAGTIANLKKIKEKNILYQNLEKLLAEIVEEQDLKEELLAEWGEIWQGEENQEARTNNKFYADEKKCQEILEEAERIIISELLEAGD